MGNHNVVIDDGTYFEIVPNTRKVTVPLAYKVIGTVGDHLSEQLTFRCPTLIDGHKIADCARHYITWENVNGDIGHDELETLDSDNEYVYFTWTIRGELAKAKGIVSFSVWFEDVNESGRTIYKWGTTTCKDCEILDSINAVLATYEAIFVAEETLIISDYTPVTNDTLELNSNAIIPEGTLKVTEMGIHDVGKYALIDVRVDIDPDFLPENIKKDVNISGIVGTCIPASDTNKNANLTITNTTDSYNSHLFITYHYFDEETYETRYATKRTEDGAITGTVAIGSIITVVHSLANGINCTECVGASLVSYYIGTHARVNCYLVTDSRVILRFGAGAEG